LCSLADLYSSLLAISIFCCLYQNGKKVNIERDATSAICTKAAQHYKSVAKVGELAVGELTLL